MRGLVILISFVTLMVSCKSTKVCSGMPKEQAPVIIYKTRLNHDKLVPVTLNNEKNAVISFPAPTDLFFKGELALPVKLRDGFLLDLRGISANTVFTSYTYETYSQMESPPPPQELLRNVIDTDPFESIYDCGKAGGYHNIVKELNAKIRKGMKGCKPLPGLH